MMKTENKILIIEDQNEILLELTNYFNENGYRVYPAKNSLDAVKVLKTKLPNLVITEVSMPKMDGFQFLEYFRKLPNAALVPIFFLSKKIDATILKKILCYNANNFLKVPFKINELDKMVKELLNKNEVLV